MNRRLLRLVLLFGAVTLSGSSRTYAQDGTALLGTEPSFRVRVYNYESAPDADLLAARGIAGGEREACAAAGDEVEGLGGSWATARPALRSPESAAWFSRSAGPAPDRSVRLGRRARSWREPQRKPR